MNIFILYGSQKGNAESISENVEWELKEKNNENENMIYRSTLNSISDNISELKNKADCIFIICSTTGNGEAPDNAYKFWKTIKNRSIPKNCFQNIKYSVLALGDTNYSNFCGPGKFINKRMQELGAECIIPLACADDASDAEKTINDWINNVINF